eukprot:CAMPEP_0174829582 /NCGR_PEP_ID=MMETSP1114-20130205/2007_1 /TAXON_ID=312471 /ORGANISM="Neobodo designis, Strain CCAP 1951/1" /LENGTH=236 /DNA_ID=CAMNT_0016063335 /DNA_START=191 /DNA_END=903 /DNA_ORIENTATION=-
MTVPFFEALSNFVTPTQQQPVALMVFYAATTSSDAAAKSDSHAETVVSPAAGAAGTALTAAVDKPGKPKGVAGAEARCGRAGPRGEFGCGARRCVAETDVTTGFLSTIPVVIGIARHDRPRSPAGGLWRWPLRVSTGSRSPTGRGRDGCPQRYQIHEQAASGYLPAVRLCNLCSPSSRLWFRSAAAGDCDQRQLGKETGQGRTNDHGTTQARNVALIVRLSFAACDFCERTLFAAQ